MAITWVASVIPSIFVFLMVLAGRPSQRSTETFEAPGIGIVLNETYIQPALWKSPAHRVNTYDFENPSARDKEHIGSHRGEAGTFKQATNLKLVQSQSSSEGRLEFIAGAFIAKRLMSQGKPRWIAWSTEGPETQRFLRRFAPPDPSPSHGVLTKGSGWWEFRLPRLEACWIDQLDQTGATDGCLGASNR